MTEIVRAATAAHFLSLVPALMQRTPRRDFVLIPFEGKRSLGSLRLDWDPDQMPGMIGKFWELAVTHTRTATAVALIVYTDRDDAVTEEETRPLLTLLGNPPLQLRDVLVVSRESYRSLLAPEITGPVSEIAGHEGRTFDAASAELPVLSPSMTATCRSLWAGVAYDLDAALTRRMSRIVGWNVTEAEVGDILLGLDKRVLLAPDKPRAEFDDALAVAAAFPDSVTLRFVAAWTAWAIGLSSVAGDLLEQTIALAQNGGDGQGHSAAIMLNMVIASGTLPLWLIAAPTAQ